MSFSGTLLKTERRDNNQNPVWNQELRFPVYIPTMTDAVVCDLFDYNKISSDRLVASTYFSWAAIQRSGWGPAWRHLYGVGPVAMFKALAAGKTPFKYRRLAPATDYLGRIRVGITASPVEGRAHSS